MENTKNILSTTLQNRSVVNSVIDVIISAIINGELGPGDKLPTEMQLSNDLGVARYSIREAIKILEAYGVVHIRRAEGTFVCDSYNQKMLDPMLYGIILQKDTWQSFITLRTVLDIGTLYVVLRQKPQTEEIQKLEALIDKMKQVCQSPAPSVDELIRIDEEFHREIALFTKNIQLVNITDYITRITIPSRKKTVDKIVSLNELDNFVDLHTQLIKVIKEENYGAIETAVLNHYVYWIDEKLN